MGYKLNENGLGVVLESFRNEYDIFAPTIFKDGAIHSDADMIRYRKISAIDEIEFTRKSNYSFKEVLLPIMQTLFYYTENQVQESDPPKKGALVFLRHCDMNAVRRLDEMYLHNGPEDFYYKRVRDKIKFAVMGCRESFENCFCVSMQTNRSDQYDFSIDFREQHYFVDCRDDSIKSEFSDNAITEIPVESDHVSKNETIVTIPENLTAKTAASDMWREYDARCIACGRCNFVCPTCTCYTMQDIFYQDNGRTGERKRVWASCMVDGFTDVAGGHSYRQKNGDRMRFKVHHKVLDYKQRFGYHMCVGCGRCDDVCPEYISFANAINKLEAAVKEVGSDE